MEDTNIIIIIVRIGVPLTRCTDMRLVYNMYTNGHHIKAQTDYWSTEKAYDFHLSLLHQCLILNRKRTAQ